MSSWPDFAKQALDKLGILAPVVIIGVLVVLGFNELQKQNAENFERVSNTALIERKAAREDFATANTALTDTYIATNRLYTSMLKSMGDSLERMRTLESELQKKQKTFLESELENEITKLELAQQRKELEAAKFELEKIRSEVRAQIKAAGEATEAAAEAKAAALRLTQQLEQDRGALAKTRQELAEMETQLASRRSELEQAVAQLTEVRGVVGDLAELSPEATAEQIADLSARAREIVPQLADFLERYRDEPENRNNLDTSKLVGLKLSELGAGINTSLREG